MDHGAFLEVAWDDCDIAALELLRCAANFIETQTGLAAFIRIGSVAAVATIGENRSHFPIKVHRRFRCPDEGSRQDADEGKRVGTHGVETLNFSGLFLSNCDSEIRRSSHLISFLLDG